MMTTKRFFKLLKQDRKDLIYLYTYAALQGLINLSLPIGIQAIMSLVLAGRLSASWTILTIVVTVGVILAGVFQIMQLYIVEMLQRKMFVRSAFDFAYRIPQFRLRGLGNSYPPEVVHRFFDVVGVQKNLNKVLLDFASSAMQILFGLILLSLYHPVFIAFGLVLIIILFLIITLTSKRGLSTSIEESNSKYKLAYWLTELARSMSSFKLHGSNRLALDRTDALATEYLGHRRNHFRIVLTQLASITGLKTLVTAGLLIIGALLLINNSITIGQFVASEIVIILVLNSSEKLIASMESIYDLLTSIEKLGKVTDLPLDEMNETGVKLEKDQPMSIKAKNLTIFGGLDDRPIIERLNFEVNAGDRFCITGPSGTGKSTLIKTLSSFLDSYKGAIEVNDIPLVNIDLRTYRESIRGVFNDQEIFFGSLIDNVSLHDPSVPDKEVMRMLDLVGLKPLVEKLPNGYYEVISNAERMLSKTDRVRLITARALVNTPRMILIEDIYSDLDEKVAKELMSLIMESNPETTIIMATNQPWAISKCNQVLNLS